MNPQKRKRQRGIAIYVTSVILVMAVPMVGLAIDGTMLYIIKCRLQGAVDGAALAGAKALSRGNDSSAQQTKAKAAAATYVMLNYPSSYFFSNSVTIDQNTDVTVDLSVAHQRTVSVTAHVVAPTLFMRWLNFTSTNVNAQATTVRKDVNIALVLDRSGSMSASGSCDPMKQAAINFVANFAPQRDYVSIISFATSTIVQVPLTQNFTQASLTTAINGIDCQGSTSSAAGLWNAYDQLVGLNQPAAMNFIVFFTDGEPTGVAVNIPIAASGSGCTAALTSPPVPTGLPAGYNGKYIRGLEAVYTNGSAYIGLAQDTGVANADGTPNIGGSGGNDQVVAPNSTGCNFAASWNSNWGLTSAFRGLPTSDVYGNALQGYQGTSTVVVSGNTFLDIGNPNNGIPAATNAADSAAARIRTATVDPVYGRGLTGVIIDSIGLGNAAVPLPADGVFLERVSNDPRSPIYNSSYPAGLYVYAQQSTDLGEAFAEIASEILRLSK